MRQFSVAPELTIGKVVEVAGDAIRIEIDSSLSELTRTHAGDVYPVGQCGSIIKIHNGRRVLFGYVRLLRMRSEIAIADGVSPPPASEDSRIIDANLIAEGQWSNKAGKLLLDRGVVSYPLPGQLAYLTTREELSWLYGESDKDSSRVRVPLGVYVGGHEAPCFADLDRLAGLHTAILGSTGTGKSGTVAAILWSILECRSGKDPSKTLRPRIVLIDPHGEYAKAFRNRCVVYRAYSAAAGDSDDGALQLRLPYWTMSGEEFRDLVISKTEFEATSENNILYKALRHSRLAARGLIEVARDDWAGKPATSGHPSDDRLIDPARKPEVASYDRDSPDNFSLSELRRYIEGEITMRNERGTWSSMSPSDKKSHESILDKLKVLEGDPRLRFMMDESDLGSCTFEDVLAQFVGDVSSECGVADADIRIVDLSGVPNEVAGPLTAAIARLLFQYKVWQTRNERSRDPVLLVCEEAHRYVPNAGLAEYASAQKAVRRVAKEGRKYGLGMMLVSQRPADVEGTVLSQCNSWIVLRLTNTSDQEHVRRFLPDSLAGLASLLPSLSRQEAIFVGDAATLPARIKIRTLLGEQLPSSDDIPFSEGWSSPPVSREEIASVVRRWRKDPLKEEVPPKKSGARKKG